MQVARLFLLQPGNETSYTFLLKCLQDVMRDLQLSPSYSARHKKCASWVLPVLGVVALAVGVFIAYKIYKK